MSQWLLVISKLLMLIKADVADITAVMVEER